MTVSAYTQSIASIKPAGEDVRTYPNAVTLIRSVVGLAFFTVAALEQSMVWNLAGLAVYWSLDCLDGYLARRLDQETRFGAQFDILADRFLIAFFYLNYLDTHPEAAAVIALYLFEFMLLDNYLSNQFMRWPILSPNYFYEVDRTIWQLNWSPPAKFFNSGMITILLLGTGSIWPVVPVLAALYGIKLYSAIRLHRLPLPEG
ncbi:MAG: CDP-alcohol phosphatidyltransferase family protein [Anaerolineae bacterium]|nr:CDP-alcohol phosphatidyltransferase family protein [Anaerolineae bacterium]